MKLQTIMALLLSLTSANAFAGLTIEECFSKAEANYPLVKKYNLISHTQTLSLEDINRQWLPSVNLYAQGTLQNPIAEFPEVLTDIMAQMGREMPGLAKLQYKIGADMTQTIWDGGSAAAQRKNIRASNQENKAALAVTLYTVREKVISLFFAALLTQEQIKQQEATIELLQANHNKIKAMITGGTAMQCDADNIEAQILTSSQKITEAYHALNSYLTMLGMYIGEDITVRKLVKPQKSILNSLKSNRPELALFEAQTVRNNSKNAEIQSGLMPRVSAFVQTFYGYPGFNNFEAMMNRKLSFNILGGVKIQWTISPLYHRSSAFKKITLANESIAAERETFLFNSDLQTSKQTSEIKTLEEIIATDSEIIRLRSSVRRAAESQLDNGIIDTVSLLSVITDETQAKLNADLHEIKLLQSIYQLKFTLNQ